MIFSVNLLLVVQMYCSDRVVNEGYRRTVLDPVYALEMRCEYHRLRCMEVYNDFDRCLPERD